LSKRYKSNRTLTYSILGGKQPRLDESSEYVIVAYAKGCENRPVIERVDGKEYEGNTRWIVDEMDLIEVNNQQEIEELKEILVHVHTMLNENVDKRVLSEYLDENSEKFNS
jgi:hypothetical protein